MSCMVRKQTAAVPVATQEITAQKIIPLTLSALRTPVNMVVPARRLLVTQSVVYVPSGLLEQDVNGWRALQMERLYVKTEEHAIKLKKTVLHCVHVSLSSQVADVKLVCVKQKRMSQCTLVVV